MLTIAKKDDNIIAWTKQHADMKEKLEKFLRDNCDFIWGGIGFLFFLSSIIGFFVIIERNNAVRWKMLFESLSIESENSLNKMRMVVKNSKIVKDEYIDSFIEVARLQSEGRAGGDDFKFIFESGALGIDKEVFLNFSNIISMEMDNFNKTQKDLINAWREHNSICLSFPCCIFLGDRVLDAPKIISSQSAKDSVESKEMKEVIF